MVILSLLAVAAIVGAFVLLGRPAFGAGLLTFCLFTRLPEIAESRFHVPTITVPLAIAVGVLGVSAAAKRGYAPTAVPLTLVLLGTRAAVMLLGWPAALNQAEVMPAVLEFVRDGAVIVGLVAAVCTPGALKSAVYGVITAGLLLGGIACLQFARGDYHNTYMELAKAPLVGVVGTTQGNRAAGPLGDPNFFAQSMVVVVALALERAFREPRRLLRTLALVTVGVGSITVLLTLSRGGLIALAAVLVVGVAWFRSWAAVGVMALAAIVAVPVFAPSGFFARLDELGQLRGGTTAVDDPAVLGRFSEMRSAYDMF
ncbi:MAG: hypothetical protein QOD38_2163, partial [Acidimicrobiaceae bacterium]